jgi:hypothetical protein
MRSALSAALVLAMTAFACSRPDATPEAAKDAPAAPAKQASPQEGTAAQPATASVAGEHFVVDATAGVCKVNEECPITLTVKASGGFHINKEFPYKFTGSDVDGVTYLGKDGAKTFGRASGDFVEKGETVGVLNVRVKGSGKGTKTVAGSFKFSVCSDANCQMEQKDLAVPVTFRCAEGVAC